MKRCLICAVFAVLFCFCNICAYADGTEHIFTEYICFDANVYLCLEDTNQIILRNVSPVIKSSDGLTKARDIEYLAIDASPVGLFKKNGEKLSFNYINWHLLDSRAMAIVGRNEFGYSLVYLCIN